MADPLRLEPAPPGRGTFLIASPRLLDPNFMHAVVLLVAHGPEGSHGIVVNRPGSLTVADLKSDHPLLDGRSDPLWVGGAVQVEALQILHRLAP
ncbi:MAG: YqgE/AlgH family protein, partial [Planctomycetota bacterium]